ncbi:hypothetical protein [Neisseria shayeganii]|uniref:Uncharacterized protein n=1 Tax=Neisseria shayeganii 871 TaxID=1032488 RepID=G4CG68_9NEIS|nr:hypothetical protein [Neisseria shayeganii]EGY53116.1 hypothetical protein HMPREF9371_0607 [Neisseria shayeganii 871]
MNKLIPVLSTDSFIRFNNWLGDADGHLNPVFIGEFNHPAGKIEAFCKLYDTSKKGLINEIVGFLVAHALGISQPHHAFIVALPTTSLPKFADIARRKQNAWMQNKTADNVVCFCTSRLDGHSAAIHLLTQKGIEQLISQQEIATDIAKWDGYSSAIALDENIAHADRHFNNLLRLSKHKYALIDNGRLINSQDETWECEMLDANQLYNNRLLNAITHRKATATPSTERLQSTAIVHAEQHEEKLKNIEGELHFWLNALLKEPESTAFRQFLTDRTKGLPCLLRQRFHRLI